VSGSHIEQMTAGAPAAPRSALPNGTRHLVVFDGLCALCHWFVRWTLARDRSARFSFAPLQGPMGQAVLRRHPRAGGVDSLLLVLRAGTQAERVLVRSDAVIAAGRELGGLWRAMAAIASLIPRRGRDAMYDFVARRRYRTFGKYDVCPLPPPASRARFLE
jgi:predicted DCC family thiol-disulfide oxidoreductase YuxK